jgi:hypothetical protein
MDRIGEDAFGRNVISYRTEHRFNEPRFVHVLSPERPSGWSPPSTRLGKR